MKVRHTYEQMYLLERMTWQDSSKSLEPLKMCIIPVKGYKCLSCLHSLWGKHGSMKLRTLIWGRKFILEWQCHQTGLIPRTMVSAVEGIFSSSSWCGESHFSMWEFEIWLWLVLRISPAPLLFLEQTSLHQHHCPGVICLDHAHDMVWWEQLEE